MTNTYQSIIYLIDRGVFMSVILIPYALANGNMTQFKEISYADYQLIVRALDKIISITKEKYHSCDHPTGSAAIKSDQLKKEYSKYTRQYTVALEKMNAFKKQHRNILQKEELLEDEEYPMPFSSIFTNVTREQLVQKHRNKHKDIYDKLRTLRATELRLRPYAPENVEHTIAVEVSNLKSRLEYESQKKEEKWDKDKQTRLYEQHQILAPFRSGYTYVITNLKITANPPTYDIYCTRRTLGNIFKNDTENCAQTLINPSLQIQR